MAREELEKPNADFKQADAGFLEGKAHPEDVRNLSLLFRRFRKVSDVDRAISAWSQADVLVRELQNLGISIHKKIQNRPLNQNEIVGYLNQLHKINENLSILEVEFSKALGKGARWLKKVLFWVTFITAIMLLAISYGALLRINNRIMRSIKSLRDGTERVQKGDFSQKIQVFSEDEIGELAIAFNEMMNGFESAINDLKKIKNQLLEAQTLSQIGSWEWDLKETVTWTDELFKIYGLDPKKTVPSYDLFLKGVHPDDREKANAVVLETLVTKKPFSAEYRILRPDGEIRYEHARGELILDESGNPVRMVGTAQDITQPKAMETQLIAMDRMIALGTLAGGIAHEINNPLTIISLKTTQLWELSKAGKLTNEHLEKSSKSIDSTIQRISKIIKGLKAFARETEHDPFTITPLSEIIAETLEFCQAKFESHGIKLQLSALRNALRLECRPVQISQVILNLLNNSFDAIEHNTTSWISIDVKDLGEMIEIAVTDSGNGLTKEVASKLMQPFFTTKGVGKGTGLGLSISQGIIKDHNGTLLYDASSQNTRFVVRLPKLQKISEFTNS